jgi:hypothetical protein
LFDDPAVAGERVACAAEAFAFSGSLSLALFGCERFACSLSLA